MFESGTGRKRKLAALETESPVRLSACVGARHGRAARSALCNDIYT
jgi:hypothetical protein